jgi:hypothetical protein
LKEVGRGGRREEKWRERKKKGGWRKEKGGAGGSRQAVTHVTKVITKES